MINTKTPSIVSMLFLFFCCHGKTEEISKKDPWPQIVPVTKSFKVSSNNANILAPLYTNEDTKPLYEIRCHEGGYENDINKFEYFGMFQCRLISLKNNKVGDLFEGTESWNTAWRTRAIFTEAQLLGECNKSEGFGFTRAFYVRGMKILLVVRNFNYSNLKDILSKQASPNFSFDFEIKVIADKSITDAYIQPTKKYCGGAFELDGNSNIIYIKEPE